MHKLYNIHIESIIYMYKFSFSPYIYDGLHMYIIQLML